MSATSGSVGNTLDEVNFTGGLPSYTDLAPSIIFVILYGLSVPVFFWRVFSPLHRTIIFIRLGLFLVVRLATLVLRAVMANNTYGISELIAELILVSIGYLFLISSSVSLWKRHVDAHLPFPHPRWVQMLDRILQLLILASIATAIAGGAMTSNAFTSPSGLTTVQGLRHASAIIALVAIAINLLAIFSTFFTYRLPARETLYLLIPTCSVIIVAVYRVAQGYSYDPNAPVRKLATFWVLDIFFEFVAYVSFLAISIPEWYPGSSGGTMADRTRADSHVEAAQANRNAAAGFGRSGQQQPTWEAHGGPNEKGLGQRILERSIIYRLLTGGNRSQRY